MPAQAAVKLLGAAAVVSNDVLTTNSATVATDVTMSPAGVNPSQVAKWVDRTDGIMVGYPWMTLSVREPTKVSRMYKVSFKLGLPRLATTSPSTNTGIEPAPSKAYELQVHCDFLLPERSTRAERVRLFEMLLSSLFTTVQASDGAPSESTGSPLALAVCDLDPVY